MTRIQWLAGSVAALPLLAAALVVWKASDARRQAGEEIHSRSEFAFRLLPVERVAPAGIDLLAASPQFRDIAAYRETIVVSARAGLFVYDRTGGLLRQYRTGIELPAGEPGPMSVGIAAGSAERELFIATRGQGVLAFNGTHFRQLLPENAELRNVTAVLVLGSGRLLLGTERQGLLVFDGQRLAPFHAALKSAHITALAGTDGDLWIGTLSGGVFHDRGGELDDLAGDLPDPQVLSLEVGGGSAFAGTPLGGVEFRGGRRFRALADGYFARALARRGDTLYVGTQDEGVVEVPLEARPGRHVSPDAESRPFAVQRLATLEGEVYAVGESAVYSDTPGEGRWREVLRSGAAVLADRNVASLAWSGGRLWVGYFDRGLDVVDASLERAVHHENDALFCINRIVEDSAHTRTAVATANGLVLFDAGGEPRQVMGRKDGLLSDHVTDVAFRAGGMVVATPAGLSLVDGGAVRSLYVFHGLVNNHVYTVAAREKQIVAGTLGGMSVLEDDTVRANYTTANSHLKHNWITALVRVGDEWFAGTYGAGVVRLDASGEWRSFAGTKDGFVVNPNAMAVSGDRVYAGSLDRGLFVFDRASGRWSNTSAGLPSKNVTAVAVAGGYLYAGTDNGVVRMAEGAVR
jgi:ligand-binding sensor domain-containing protein